MILIHQLGLLSAEYNGVIGKPILRLGRPHFCNIIKRNVRFKKRNRKLLKLKFNSSLTNWKFFYYQKLIHKLKTAEATVNKSEAIKYHSPLSFLICANSSK